MRVVVGFLGVRLSLQVWDAKISKFKVTWCGAGLSASGLSSD